MSILLFLSCYCDILNRFHWGFLRTKRCLVRQIIVVERVIDENGMYNKTVIEFDFLGYPELSRSR